MDLVYAFEKRVSLAEGGKLSRFLFTPVKYLVGMFARYLAFGLFGSSLQRVCRTFTDQEFDVLLPSGLDIYLTGIKTHPSEIRLVRFLLKHVTPGMLCYDVGAHFGYYTQLMAILSGMQGSVISFEPHPVTFHFLERNVSSLPQVTAINAAVGNANTALHFTNLPSIAMESNRVLSGPEKGSIEVPGISLATAFTKYGLPEMIKIDVEGAEPAVIDGMQDHLGRIRYLLMEYIPRSEGPEYEMAVDKIRAAGLAPYWIDDNGHPVRIDDVRTFLTQKGSDSDNILFQR